MADIDNCVQKITLQDHSHSYLHRKAQLLWVFFLGGDRGPGLAALLDLGFLLATLFPLLEEAGAADGLVHLRASDQLDLLALHDALGEGGLGGAVDADRAQLGHLFCEGDEVEDVAEGLALEGAVEGGDQHDLVLVGQGLAKLDDLREELPLVDADHIVALAEREQLHELVGLERLLGDPEWRNGYLSCVAISSQSV